MNDSLISTIDVTTFETVSHTRSIRQDLHRYVSYMQERTVKRSYRDNDLPKADVKRLAKLLGDGDQRLGDHYSSPTYIEVADQLAHQLEFVSYDTEGEYAGYSSHSPTFRDNYVQFEQQNYQIYLAQSLQEQEQLLLYQFSHTTDNVLFARTHLSRLDRFDSFGRATGAMQHVNLRASHRFLQAELAKLKPNIWYDTASWIDHIERVAPYFLIPKKIPSRKIWGGKKEAQTRYGNFYELPPTKSHHGRDDTPIADDAPNGFQRVEGRFIERFLEGYLLLLNHLDVAYGPAQIDNVSPSLGRLRAFRLKPHFIDLMNHQLRNPLITVQPDFQIYVDTPLYAPSTDTQLSRFASLKKQDTVTIYELEKQRVKATAASDEALDVVQALQALADRPLPKNVVIELQEWSQQADTFTLYENYTLFEGTTAGVQSAELFELTISDQFRLTKQPSMLQFELGQNERVVLTFAHSDKLLHLLPKGVQTAFPVIAPAKTAKRKTKPRIELSRETFVTITIPDTIFFEQFCASLVEKRAIFEVDNQKQTVRWPKNQQKTVDGVIKLLRNKFTIKISDIN